MIPVPDPEPDLLPADPPADPDDFYPAGALWRHHAVPAWMAER